jgi:PPOX class probable F420-dependent enzyme
MLDIENLHDKRYIALETYRKNNLPVRTPVWFVILDGLIHVVTRKGTGKIKRLQNNKSVKIAMCTFNGKPTGDWVSGIAKFVTEEKSKRAIELRRKKYGFIEKIAQFVSRKYGKLIVFSIELENI